MESFNLCDLQKEIMRKLWVMRNNFGTNIIQMVPHIRFKSRVEQETVLKLPIDVSSASQSELDSDSQTVEELFDHHFIDHIAGQDDMFICIGEEGIRWCQQNEENNEHATSDR